MNMKILKREHKLCVCCMGEHEVYTVHIAITTIFHNKKVRYDDICYYCDKADELYMDEQQMQENYLRMKDAYNKIVSQQATSSPKDTC